MLHRLLLWLTLCLALGLSACTALESQALEAQATATATQTPSPSPTIVWFPPTNTPTPLPSPVFVPTPDQRPGLGAVIYQDDFEERTRWQTFSGATGSVAYGIDELTIAISQPKGILLSLSKEPFLDDFYLEITANPSLCRGADAYGLLLRATTYVDYYRFLISCSGELRLERVKNGRVALLQDWTPSGQVPPGSPLLLRLGVWTAGNEMRFFVNDIYQFRASDPVWRSGNIGVFARSGGENALTVSFSDLIVRSVGAAPRSSAPTPQPASAGEG